jgi:hypothetical protein
MKAVVPERNRLGGRRIARIWGCAGVAVETIDDPAALPGLIAGAELLAADAFDAEVVLAALRQHPHLRAALWTAENAERVLRFAAAEPRLENLFGRASFEVTPRDWELLLVGRRLGGGVPPSLVGYLAWGGAGFEERVGATSQIAEVVDKVQQFAQAAGAPRRGAEMVGELTHELVMNAVYDAPIDVVDGVPRPRHAHDRKTPVILAPGEDAVVRVGSDGVRIALQVIDPFGALRREHVFPGLVRGLGGDMDRSGGGAGLGLTVCLQSTVALVFDVVAGRRTSVTGVFDLDLNLREFRQQAKSLHFFGT